MEIPIVSIREFLVTKLISLDYQIPSGKSSSEKSPAKNIEAKWSISVFVFVFFVHLGGECLGVCLCSYVCESCVCVVELMFYVCVCVFCAFGGGGVFGCSYVCKSCVCLFLSLCFSTCVCTCVFVCFSVHLWRPLFSNPTSLLWRRRRKKFDEQWKRSDNVSIWSLLYFLFIRSSKNKFFSFHFSILFHRGAWV